MAHPIPPYGVAIQDAIASGDIDKMRQVADDAEKYLQEFGEIGEGLKKLRAAISGGGAYGGGIHTLYAPAMRAAIAAGDTDKMKDLANQAETALGQADEVRSALAEIRMRVLRPNSSVNVTWTRFGSQRRLVWRWLCETLWPVMGRLPVIGHTLDIALVPPRLPGMPSTDRTWDAWLNSPALMERPRKTRRCPIFGSLWEPPGCCACP